MPSSSIRATSNDEEEGDHGVAGSRQERQLMRQRGAGSRYVTNVDFGFAFPTPRRQLARRSHSRTSGALAQPSSKISRTPSRAVDTLASVGLRSVDDTRHASNVAPAETGRERSLLHDFQQSASKRRKLNEITNTVRRVDQEYTGVQVESGLQDPGVASRPNIPEARNDQENVQVIEQLSKKKDKHRRSPLISRQELFERRLKPIDAHADGILQGVGTGAGVQDLDPGPEPSTGPHRLLEDEHISQDVPDTEESAGLQKPRKRKKRKSITGRKRISVHRDTGQNEGRSRKSPSRSSNVSPHRSLVHHNSSILTPGVSVSTQRREERESRSSQRSISPPPRSLNPRSEASEDEYQPDAPSPESIHVRPRRKKPTKAQIDCVKETSIRKRGSFPITVHRINNPQSLPTILEDEETSEPGVPEDSRATVPPAAFSVKVQPNAIDVFSQICSETISKYIAPLRQSTSANSTAARVSLLEAFSTTLQSELLMLSQTLDNRNHLEARLRKSQREKAALQAQWLAVRHQRDRLALDGDRLRREHWEQERVSNRACEVSEAARRIDTFAKCSISDDGWNGLEFTLKKVSTNVSSKVGGAGLLDRVRNLNRLLETLADAA